MKTSVSPFLIVCLSLLAFSCREDEAPPRPKVYEVPELVQPYIEDFISEAAARGLNVEVDDLIVRFESNLQNGEAAGLCTFRTDGATPEIRLDTTSANWQNNPSSRESLVFHELGHCILDRPHKDNFLPNGNYVSIMRAKGEQLFGERLNAFKRSYYLDELFNESVDPPEWSLDPPAYGSIAAPQLIELYEESFNSVFDVDPRWSISTSPRSIRRIENGTYYFESLDEGAYFSFITQRINPNTNFEIEASIKVVKGEQATMLEWGGNAADNLNFLGFTNSDFAFIGNWEVGAVATRDWNGIRRGDFNKLTVRKLGEEYFFYINEELFDSGQFEGLINGANGTWIAFYVGALTAIQVDYLKISTID